MVDSDSREVFVFYHVPKTGGISINHLLNEKLIRGVDFIDLGLAGQEDDAEHGRLPIEKRSREERSKVRVISGHEVFMRTEQLFPDRTPRRITFLRKPASRIVSAFNYETSHAAPFTRWDETVPFETWYRHQERDVMTKFLAKRVIRNRLGVAFAQGQRFARYPLHLGSGTWVFEQVQQALSQFWFVGCTESLSSDMPKIARRIGIEGGVDKRNATGRNFSRRLDLTPELEARLAEDNRFDTELYEHWKGQIASRLTEIEAESAANG